MEHSNFRRPNEKAARILAALLALAVWELAARLLNNRLLLVGPVQVLIRLGQLAGTERFWAVTGFTFSRITMGFLLGFGLALMLASAAAGFPVLETLLHPYMAAVQTVPVASFIVIALLWLRSSRLGGFIAFLMVLPVLYANFLQGIRAADPKLLEMAAVFRMSFFRKVRCIYAPAVRPYIFSACRVALGLCWKAGVAAELIGVSTNSIGGQLYDAKVYLEIADLLAWTLMIVMISICFEKLFLWVMGKVFCLLEGR